MRFSAHNLQPDANTMLLHLGASSACGACIADVILPDSAPSQDPILVFSSYSKVFALFFKSKLTLRNDTT